MGRQHESIHHERKDRFMKSLIVEDDFTSRLFLQTILVQYGEAHIAVDGHEALAAIKDALSSGHPYDVVCLDIMMPGMDGHTVLDELRKIEEAQGIRGLRGVKVIMTTALSDMDNIMGSFKGQCDGYMVKPIDSADLVKHLKVFKLIDG
jgi:two-component system, chemotaxis family, chemotaxis protein CheY